jgi:nitroimidazol reductase NimA-like FMN-containing flavoprotein (pyridoxamine 5'-phosphate oxidase superfamily)
MTKDYTTLTPTASQRLPAYKRDDAWIADFLQRTEIAHIGHVNEGQPFVTPVNFFYDAEKHSIYFHGSKTGRKHFNFEQNPKVCMEISEHGRMLPSNSAFEFGVQYRSVMVFGEVSTLDDAEQARRALTSLITKYFPRHRSGSEYRPITDDELGRTSVFVVKIAEWSGKENWKDAAQQVKDWPQLSEDLKTA